MYNLGSELTNYRIKQFIDDTKGKEYKTKKDYTAFFESIRELIYEYVVYYDRKRKKKQWQTIIFRYLIAFITFCGIIFPILDIFTDTILSISSDKFAEVGHSLLVISAILYGIKNFLGSTNGHIRYAKTQLKLESLIAIYTIKQNEVLSSITNNCGITQSLTKENKDMFNKVCADFFIASSIEIQGETTQWGKDILSEENNFFSKYFKDLEKEKDNAETNNK